MLKYLMTTVCVLAINAFALYGASMDKERPSTTVIEKGTSNYSEITPCIKAGKKLNPKHIC